MSLDERFMRHHYGASGYVSTEQQDCARLGHLFGVEGCCLFCGRVNPLRGVDGGHAEHPGITTPAKQKDQAMTKTSPPVSEEIRRRLEELQAPRGWRELLVEADSMLSAAGHGRDVSKEEMLSLSGRIRVAYERELAPDAPEKG